MADDLLGLILGLLVGIAKTLADIEVLLAETSGVLARDIRRGDVGQAPQAAARVTACRELEHTPRSLHVDRAGLL